MDVVCSDCRTRPSAFGSQKTSSWNWSLFPEESRRWRRCPRWRSKTSTSYVIHFICCNHGNQIPKSPYCKPASLQKILHNSQISEAKQESPLSKCLSGYYHLTYSLFSSSSTDVFICTSPIKHYSFCPHEKVRFS